MKIPGEESHEDVDSTCVPKSGNFKGSRVVSWPPQ